MMVSENVFHQVRAHHHVHTTHGGRLTPIRAAPSSPSNWVRCSCCRGTSGTPIRSLSSSTSDSQWPHDHDRVAQALHLRAHVQTHLRCCGHWCVVPRLIDSYLLSLCTAKSGSLAFLQFWPLLAQIGINVDQNSAAQIFNNVRIPSFYTSPPQEITQTHAHSPRRLIPTRAAPLRCTSSST